MELIEKEDGPPWDFNEENLEKAIKFLKKELNAAGLKANLHGDVRFIINQENWSAANGTN